MRTKYVMLAGGAALLVLFGVALWILFQPPRGHAQTAKLLTATNPALDLRYSYDPDVFHPAPYDQHAEFPLRLDAKDWSFYGSRIQGAGDLLSKQPQPVVYSFIDNEYSSIFTDFYKLHPEGESHDQQVTLGGQQAVRQQLVFDLAPDSVGWPPYFPESVRGTSVARFLDRTDPRAEKIFGGIPEVEKEKKEIEERDAAQSKPKLAVSNKAYVYNWALFNKSDLFYFQAVSSRALDDDELADAERLIDSLEFDALLAAPANPPDGAKAGEGNGTAAPAAGQAPKKGQAADSQPAPGAGNAPAQPASPEAPAPAPPSPPAAPPGS
jgi:hypothetical protein